MKVVKTLIEENEQDFPYAGGGVFEMLGDAIERDLGGFLGRISVCAGADGWKADGARAAFLGKFQAFAIATGQLGRFVVQAILINWPDGVNHILRRKRAAGRHHGTSWRATANPGADFVQLPHDR